MSGGLLVVTAHPDDETLIAGGTLAACAAAGFETGVVCLTRGEHGPISDPLLATPETLSEVRLAELHAACTELDVAWLECFRRGDAHLPWTNGTAIARQIARLVGVHRPAAVITFGADGLYGHDDHIATRRYTGLALDHACRAGIAPTALYEAVWDKRAVAELVSAAAARGLPDDLWGIDADDFGLTDAEGTVAIDVRPFLARKLAALRAHRTQLGPHHLFSAIDDELAGRFFGWERFRLARPGAAGDWLNTALGAGS
jgi:N-acetyl-1-D-myo-inositol-2-amino-2-deoxy-alpha-D-glucopyranoside deacetylase